MFPVGTKSRLLRLKMRSSPSLREASTITTKPTTNSPWTTAAPTTTTTSTTTMIQIGKRQRSNIMRTNIPHIKSSSVRTISISPRTLDSSSVSSSSCYRCSSKTATRPYFNEPFVRNFTATSSSIGGTSNHNKSQDGTGRPSRPPRLSSSRQQRSAAGATTTTTASPQRPRGITHRLLQTPLGSLSTPQFQQQTTNQIRFHISQNKKTGADQALLLVERLLREQLETEVPTLLDTEILMDVLKCCRRKSVDMKKLEVVGDLLLAPPFFKSDERVGGDDGSALQKGGGFWSQKMLGILLGGITKCHGRNAPDRALALLDRITVHQQEIGEVVVTPNSFSYNAILAGYAKHGLVRRAEDLLHRMHHQDKDEDSKPDTVSYSCVMNAISRSNAADAPKRAKALLEQMLSSKILPDVVTWNSLLNCYANRGMAKEAEEWLERMETLQKKTLLTDGPNTISYNSVLNAWAKSDHADAPQRAKELLSRMVALQDEGNSKEEGQGRGGGDGDDKDKDDPIKHSKQNKKSGVQVEPNKITQTSFLLCFEKNNCMQEGYDEWERITHQNSPNIL